MKRLILLPVFFFFLAAANAQSSLLDSSLIRLTGQQQTLSDYAGKKLWIVVLPLGRGDQDAFFMRKLDSICDSYSRRIETIGVVSYEAGYTDSQLAALQDWLSQYSRPNLIITKGMHIKKGGLQSGLFRWLTDAHRNGHFDMDTGGAGQQFLVDATGKLYRVSGTGIILSWRGVSKMLN